MGDLADFPTDDATLLALEHAMGGVLTMDRPDGAPDDGGPWLIGADYSLSELLDFLSGTREPDPEKTYRVDGDMQPMDADQIARDDVLGVDQWVVDERPHYTERDVIRALITEVRRLRQETVR